MTEIINIETGANVNLATEAPTVKKLKLGLGWDINKSNNASSNEEFDLDASVLLLDDNNRSRPEWFIFYGNETGPNGCIRHNGDNTDGKGDGDDEEIFIDLDLIPEAVTRIAIPITIYAAEERNQNFGSVENAFCRIVDTKTEEEIIHIDLNGTFSCDTAIIAVEFIRHGEDWRFKVVGKGYIGGLQAICQHYGLDAQYLDED